MQSDIDPRSLIGRKAFDAGGGRVGTVGEVYLDDATGEPEWAALRVGVFRREVLVPLEPSEVLDDGLHIPFERSLIRSTPNLGVGRHLSPVQELRLYLHYGLEVPAPAEGGPSASYPDASPSVPDAGLGRIAGSES